jgi:hypothetical protein
MAKVKVNLERSICVGSHGGFLLTIGEREYHDDVAKAIVVAGFGEYVDKPVVVERVAVVDAEPMVIMQDEPAAEEKQHVTPENKMMPEAPENKRKNKAANKPA